MGGGSVYDCIQEPTVLAEGFTDGVRVRSWVENGSGRWRWIYAGRSAQAPPQQERAHAAEAANQTSTQ